LAKFRPGPKLPSLIIVFLLAGPVLAGLAGTVLPAFGYLPVLGARTLTFAPFAQLLSMPGLLHSTALSFWTGLVASLVSLAIVLCFAAAWSGTHTFQRVSRFLSPLLSVPHAAAAIGLAFLIAPSGFLARLLSPWATGWERPPDLLLVNDPYGIAMTLGLVAKEVPFLFLMTLAALNRPEIKSYTKVATSLGYGRMSGFFKVILPQIYPLIRLPMLAVIAYSTSVVDVAVILGPTTPAPLAARLVVWMNDPDLNLRLAASAGALLQLGVSAGAILVYLLFEASVTKLSFTRFALGHRVKSDGAGRMAALGTMVFIVSAMCLSLLVLMIWSLAKSWWYPAPLPQNWSVSALSMALMQTPQILGTTILLGVLAALISTSLTLWLSGNKNTRRGASRSSTENAHLCAPPSPANCVPVRPQDVVLDDWSGWKFHSRASGTSGFRLALCLSCAQRPVAAAGPPICPRRSVHGRQQSQDLLQGPTADADTPGPRDVGSCPCRVGRAIPPHAHDRGWPGRHRDNRERCARKWRKQANHSRLRLAAIAYPVCRLRRCRRDSSCSI
jgi:ABC-type uncharacterized transport system YnjBCD permease subunit